MAWLQDRKKKSFGKWRRCMFQLTLSKHQNRWARRQRRGKRVSSGGWSLHTVGSVADGVDDVAACLMKEIPPFQPTLPTPSTQTCIKRHEVDLTVLHHFPNYFYIFIFFYLFIYFILFLVLTVLMAVACLCRPRSCVLPFLPSAILSRSVYFKSDASLEITAVPEICLLRFISADVDLVEV